MLSDNKKELLLELCKTVTEIDQALLEDHSDHLVPLVTRHNTIMDALQKSDDATDNDLTDVIFDARGRIETVISRIKTLQSEILDRLSAVNNRRLIQTAYQYSEER